MKSFILSPLVLRRRNQAGLTLVELMISITLGLMVTLAATALLVSSKSTYLSQDDGTQLQDGARFALDSINRSVRQAGYENWDKNGLGAPIISTPDMDPSIRGLDATVLNGGPTSLGIDSTTSTGVVNGSDVLAIRFFGVNDPITAGNAEESIVDCAGNGVSAPTDQANADTQRGWSIYYVALSATTGEPELRCRYRSESTNKWKSEAIASGVESFQVLYGVDTDGAVSSPVVAGDRIANQFLTATQINALDAAATPARTNVNTYWKRVTAIKIALLMRGTQNRQADIVATKYDLFGEQYSSANAANDTGAKITVSNISTAVRNRTRKVYVSTIQLRNQNEGSGS